MKGCKHVFQPKGRFYERKQWVFGGQLFVVFSYRQCTLCNKLERRIVLRKRVAKSPDTFERQLRFSGVKPETQLN